MGWIVGHGWWSFSHFRDFSFLLAFSSRCSSVCLAGTTVQGLPSCDKASSSMYLGEVSSNELAHLDEEVAYIDRMNWRWFTMLCTKVLWQQRWRQCRCGDGAAERMVGGKVGDAGRGARAASLLLTGLNTFEQTTWILRSSCDWCWPLLHQDVSVHHLILLLNAWMILLHHSQKILTL